MKDRKRMILRFYKHMTLSELKLEKKAGYWGCDNKIDFNGDCMHFSTKGTMRYCGTCRKHLKEIQKCIDLKKRL